MTEHTKTPWRVDWTLSGCYIDGMDGHGIIAAVRPRKTKTNNLDEQTENAEFIVKAVNSHDAQVER